MYKVVLILYFTLIASAQCALNMTSRALAHGDVHPHLHMASPPGNLPLSPRSSHLDSTLLFTHFAFGFLLSLLSLFLLAHCHLFAFFCRTLFIFARCATCSYSSCSRYTFACYSRWLFATLAIAFFVPTLGFFATPSACASFVSALPLLLALLAFTLTASTLASGAIIALRFLRFLAVPFLRLLALAFLKFIGLLADFCFAPCTFIVSVLSYLAMTFTFLAATLPGLDLESWLSSPFRRVCIYSYALHTAASNRLSSSRNLANRLRFLHSLASASSIFRLLLASILVLYVHAADDASTSSKPPLFDGTRASFVSWIMVFTAWIAWKQTDVVGVMEGTIARPVEPVEPVEPVNPATLSSTDPHLAAVTALHHAWTADHAAWVANHCVWAKEMVVYSDLNTKLYGAILQAVPEYLRTGLYLTYRNDGYAALESLRNQFDAVDANDHAAHMARLQGRYIDGKSDISENDLRRQYDTMMTAAAGIQRTGNAVPNQAALIAIFDNSLPISYSQIRQLVRRSKHVTFSAHYEDYMAQVRAELSARAPAISAFSASSSHISNPNPSPSGNHGDQEGSSRRSNGGGSNLCLRCAKPGHTRPKCKKPKKTCKHCGSDHSSRLCPKGPGSRLRDSLSDAARRLLDADVSRMANSSSSDSDSDSDKGATNPPVTKGTPVLKDATDTNAAHLAASAAAAACDNPEAAGQAYIAALKALGF